MTQKTQTVSGDRIWLVGGSEGIGLALADRLLDSGAKLVVSARSAEQNIALLGLRDRYPQSLRLLNLDVTQKADLSAKIDQAWSFFNGLDVWIYNAGVYGPMTVDTWDVADFERMNAVNYLGAVYLMHGLLPKFRQDTVKSSSIQWLWNVSLASDFGLPYGGAYSAPKAALLNLAESLYPELKAIGIQLKVVNHGFVKTRLTDKNNFPMLGIMTADNAAKRIQKALSYPRFETRFPFSLATLLGFIKRLPKSWALRITQGMLKK